MKVSNEPVREEAVKIPKNKRFKENLREILLSKRALTVPVTYLILFVSLIAIISLTYNFAVIRIGTKAASIKAYVAKNNMKILDDAISSVAWSLGKSQVVYLDDCGGVFRTEATAKNLVLNFTDEQTFYKVIFGSPVGEVSYKLEPSESSYYGFFIRGDYRAIINQSASIMTQLYITTTDEAQAIILNYRPLVTSVALDEGNGKPLNIIRVNIINLNSSQSLMLKGKFNLKVTALNVTTISHRYEFNQSISSLALKAAIDENQSSVWIPISSTTQGATVNLEIVICDIKIQKIEV